MEFRFSEEQELLRDSARALVGDLIDPAKVRSAIGADGDAVRSALWSAITELGWSSVLIADEHGGSGGSLVDACILAEELAAGLAPVPFVAAAVGAAGVLSALDDRPALAALADGQPMSLLLDRRLRWPGATADLMWDWLPGGEAIHVTGTTASRHAVLFLFWA